MDRKANVNKIDQWLEKLNNCVHEWRTRWLGGDRKPHDEIENSLKTPVQATVKREDEQAFALLNGSNLMFCEDAGRRIQTALNHDERILDYWARCTHYESLHPHNAVSVVTKGLEGGYVAGAGAPVRLELSRTK